MKHRRVTSSLPLLFPALAAAAVFAAHPPDLAADGESAWRRRWVRRGTPMTKRMCAVLDVSGSMRGDPLAKGHQELLAIFGMFPDDGFLKVIRFSNEPETFPGGWHRLPDAELVEKVAGWLSVRASGNTHIGAALELALADEAPNLSVILVTDGDPNDSNAFTLEKIEKAQKRRKAGPAPIHVIAVWEIEPAERHVELVNAIAEQNDGALVTWRLGEEPAVVGPR